MTKQEFEKLVDKEVSERDYKVIEKVYTFHPAISNTNGKQQIAMLYNEFGMGVIKDMVLKSEMAMDIEAEITRTKDRLRELEEELEALK